MAKKKPKSNNVPWRRIMNWTGLDNFEKLFLLVVRFRSSKDGWAKLSKEEIRHVAGGLDNRTQDRVVASLKSNGFLLTAPSENKYKMLYRVENAAKVS
jgi:hypothetical protein